MEILEIFYKFACSTSAAGSATVLVAPTTDIDAVISGGRCCVRCCRKHYEESEGRETHGCWSTVFNDFVPSPVEHFLYSFS